MSDWKSLQLSKQSAMLVTKQRGQIGDPDLLSPALRVGILSPIVAAGAMAMSSVTVVMNSLRLRK